MADDQITPILVAIAKLETKMDMAIQNQTQMGERISKLEKTDAGFGAIRSFIMAAPGFLSLAAWIFIVLRGG